MLLSLVKKKKKGTHTHTNTQEQQTETATTYNSPCLHHRWRCYQAIALNDQQIWPTSHKKIKDREIEKYTYLRADSTAQSNVHSGPLLQK